MDWVVFVRRAFPGEQPGLGDAVLVHICDELLQIVAMPIGMIMRVDNHLPAPLHQLLPLASYNWGKVALYLPEEEVRL